MRCSHMRLSVPVFLLLHRTSLQAPLACCVFRSKAPIMNTTPPHSAGVARMVTRPSDVPQHPSHHRFRVPALVPQLAMQCAMNTTSPLSFVHCVATIRAIASSIGVSSPCVGSSVGDNAGAVAGFPARPSQDVLKHATLHEYNDALSATGTSTQSGHEAARAHCGALATSPTSPADSCESDSASNLSDCAISTCSSCNSAARTVLQSRLTAERALRRPDPIPEWCGGRAAAVNSGASSSDQKGESCQVRESCRQASSHDPMPTASRAQSQASPEFRRRKGVPGWTPVPDLRVLRRRGIARDLSEN